MEHTETFAERERQNPSHLHYLRIREKLDQKNYNRKNKLKK
jgi:hypothetical protein